MFSTDVKVAAMRDPLTVVTTQRIHRAYKTELAPNQEQLGMLRKHVGAARFAYNWGLQWFVNVLDYNRLPHARMRLDVKLQSPELLRALVSILKTLRQTVDQAGAAFMRAMRLAWAISEAAVSWGNVEARNWRNDRNYIVYLAGTT